VKTLYNSVMARGDVVIANSGYTAELILAKHPALRATASGSSIAAPISRPSRRPPSAPERVQALRKAWGSSRISASCCCPAG
jgi:hypothetical protein